MNIGKSLFCRIKGKPIKYIISRILQKLLSFPRYYPYFLRAVTFPEYHCQNRFVKRFVKDIPSKSKVLDAGGTGSYRDIFTDVELDYESTNLNDPTNIHTFVCDLTEAIPRSDNYYDVIINLQVLEHVQYPQKVVDEFYRVLKPNGKLYLTAPLNIRYHGSPDHYYNFTKSGLELIFTNSGFRIVDIKPQNGMFWYLAHRLNSFPFQIIGQYTNKPLIFVFLLIPFILLIPILHIISFLMFPLDWIDKEKNYTFGYNCVCVK